MTEPEVLHDSTAPDPTDTTALPRLQPPAALRMAVVGAGPVGLALALLAAQRLPDADITVFDARPADKDVSGDARTLALSLGSVQLLQRLDAWQPAAAEPIREVHVSQQSFSPAVRAVLGREPQVRIRAADEGVDMLGAVLPYGAIVAPLQQAWFARAALEPQRLHSRFGLPVAAIEHDHGAGAEASADGTPPAPRRVRVDAGITDTFDLVVVAEGGVFADQARKAVAHDYRQTAWVGTVTLEGAAPGTAWERFTRQGPVALLPLPAAADAHDAPPGRIRASLVWCTDARDDPVEPLTDAQRIAVLQTLLHDDAGRVTSITPLKRFPLGLNAERTLTDGAIVRIGNAAQTLHPVAGQGLNLGLRDAWELVDSVKRSEGRDLPAALRWVEWKRAPDRWALIATTDFLARSFTWDLPGAALARGVGLALLDVLGPVKRGVARGFMFGRR